MLLLMKITTSCPNNAKPHVMRMCCCIYEAQLFDVRTKGGKNDLHSLRFNVKLKEYKYQRLLLCLVRLLL